MNKKTGVISSIVNAVSVVGFAVSMLAGIDFCSYLFSVFIAFSFVTMMCCYGFYADSSRKIPGICAAVFSAIYAAIIFIVYFAQLTTVRYSELGEQAAMLLDFSRFGLMFNYDLLGYAIMALSTLCGRQRFLGKIGLFRSGGLDLQKQVYRRNDEDRYVDKRSNGYKLPAYTKQEMLSRNKYI